MKTRHIFKALTSAFLISLFVSSCSKENLSSPAEDTSDEYVEVALNCTGEIIDMGQTPLSRAGGDDLYYIQIFEIDESDYNEPFRPYIHGLFDYNPSGVKIELKGGNTYMFIANMVENGKNLIYSEDTYYYAPFLCPLTNSFVEERSFPILAEYNDTYSAWLGVADIRNENYDYMGRYYTPTVPRYFGYTEYVARENSSVQINMIKTYFGLDIVSEGFKESDVISVTLDGAPAFNMWANTRTQSPVIYTLYDIIEAYSQYLEGRNYSELIQVGVRLYDNELHQWKPVAVEPVRFYRNMKTTIRIKNGSNPIEDSGIDIDISEPELTDDPEEEIFEYYY